MPRTAAPPRWPASLEPGTHAPSASLPAYPHCRPPREFARVAARSPAGGAFNAAASVVLSGTGDPRVARNPSGHGFGQKIMPVTGRGFLNVQFFLLTGLGLGWVNPAGLDPLPSLSLLM